MYTFYIGESDNQKTTGDAEKEEKTLDQVVAIGEVMTSTLKRTPLTLTVNLESVEAVALLDRRAK